MTWNKLTVQAKAYLRSVYAIGALLSFVCMAAPARISETPNRFDSEWVFLTLVSLFVATVTVRLPRTPSAVISIGDVFTILALLQFGPGPALVMYWSQIIILIATDQVKRRGWRSFVRVSALYQHFFYYKHLFNLATCALSISAMSVALMTADLIGLSDPLGFAVKLAALATVWFAVNTGTLSLAIALLEDKSFWKTWFDGVSLYVLNFFGSAAAAGLMSQFYEQAGFSTFLFALPIVVVFYQLYRFYIEKFEHARAHIAELNKLYLQTVEALATAVDAKDRYTHGHIRRVQCYAIELARRMGMTDEWDLMAIRSGALLHDIGKIAIPEYILNKPTVLTESEFEKMKIHPSIGASMLKGIEFPFPVEPLVKSHHERWDGKGYPEGLSGEEIPLSARILSLVDCYDALTTNRPYRAPMSRDQVIEFFRRESGRAYDPEVVETFVANIGNLEEEATKIEIPDSDIWGGLTVERRVSENVRALEKVQPTVTYSDAMNVTPFAQTELYSVFEFVRAANCLRTDDVLAFIGIKLRNLIQFDAAVFYLADLDRGVVVPSHVLGRMGDAIKEGVPLPLDQKLSGWVAANNQALRNLPPFPDFRNFHDPKPRFEISSIAPMNHRGIVVGSLALYREAKENFSDLEFRHLEIIAAQAAVALNRAREQEGTESALFDELTELPNGYQMYLMFDQVATDALRYEYPLALMAFRLDEFAEIKRRYGHLSTAEVVRFISRYLKDEVRDTDILVRYADDQFLTLNPKMSRDQSEVLKSRIQSELDRHKFMIRHGIELAPRVSIGIAEFPEEATKLEDLLSIAEWRLTEDERLRSMARRTLSFPS